MPALTTNNTAVQILQTMTLATDTAAILNNTIASLNNLTSPSGHALLTPQERRSALQQLLTTVEAAAKLADVVHLEALTAYEVTGGGVRGGEESQRKAEGEGEAETDAKVEISQESVRALIREEREANERAAKERADDLDKFFRQRAQMRM
ncbi:hypothetical protein DFP73DRAFT_601079 [Morchella snyderi]|nr:hypothetical protein DFP73DRAFT_601079 [Morchella snyderi]